MIDAIKKEIEFRKNFLQGTIVETIYFGGGTPSVLPEDSLSEILDHIYQHFNISTTAEITLEANPDDLTTGYLKALETSPVNRLSIGIQTFDDKVLAYINRSHSALQAEKAIEQSRAFGFQNINLDLIYAIPGRTNQTWEADIKKCLSFSPEHLSCYGLTIEEKTTFGNWLTKGKLQPVEEHIEIEQYEYLIDALESQQYEQYEVSNFCRDGYYSKHNSSYWHGKPYLGIGPGAHSYDLSSRYHNVSNNAQYMRDIAATTLPLTQEKLSQLDFGNEYLLTRLRTKWGINTDKLSLYFSPTQMEGVCSKLDYFKKEGYVYQSENQFFLSKSGKLLADRITEDLIYI